MNDLPIGWAIAAIGDVCAQPKQRVPATEESFTYIDITSIDRDLKIILQPQYLLGADAPSRARKVVEEGDIIVSMTRPNLNAVALVCEQHNDCIASTGFDVLRPIEVDPRWVFSAVKSMRFVNAMCEKVQGALYPAVKSADIREHVIALPPLDEQTRIAQKLDELLTQVDSLKARIDAIPTLLKHFHQSVLAAAVSGKLTEDWRTLNQPTPISLLLDKISQERDSLKKSKQLKPSFGKYTEVGHLYPLPGSAWSWVCLDQISKNENNALKAGPFGSALKKSDCVATGFKVYGQEQVISGDEGLSTYFIDKQKFKDLGSCRVEEGDILVSLVGTIGKVLILSEEAEVGVINPRLVKASLAPEISREYVKIYMDSIIAHDFFKQFSHGGTMEILNLGILKKLPIPLPPLAEQTEIVRRVEQLFAFADQLEAKVAAAKNRIDHLTQSILAKAFRGELVPQDPNDEPASVLLERIKAQRAAAPKVKRGRKASV